MKKPAPTDTIIIELDEMWHYLKKENKLWIWKAYCREAGQLIDWECGGRDKKTLLKLKNRLKKWNVEFFALMSIMSIHNQYQKINYSKASLKLFALNKITDVKDIGLHVSGESQ